MDIDMSLVLVCLVALCGAIWCFDGLFLAGARARAGEKYLESHGSRVSKAVGETEFEEIIKEPVLTEYAKSFFPVLMFVLVLRSFLFEPFMVPTGSMIPTIKIGDFIVVNKFAYGLRLPVIGTKIFEVSDPQRGEVMVFIPPHENKYYVKRVVGLPGDTIRYENKSLTINGEPVNKKFDSGVEIQYGENSLNGNLYQETLGGVSHFTQYIDLVPANRGRNSWIVPPGHYFMMGDNRDNSMDSRVWGVVSEDKIVGRAFAVWMHKDPGLNLPNFSNNRMLK
jgi:signal peptidase I